MLLLLLLLIMMVQLLIALGRHSSKVKGTDGKFDLLLVRVSFRERKKREEKKVGGERSIFFLFPFSTFDLFPMPPPSSSSRALLRGLGHPSPGEIKNLRELVEWLEHTKVRESEGVEKRMAT